MALVGEPLIESFEIHCCPYMRSWFMTSQGCCEGQDNDY